MTRTKAKTDIYTRIKAAMPLAQRLLIVGIDDQRCEFSDDLPVDLPDDMPEMSDDILTGIQRWAEAHYVVGIAVGLLLRGDLVLQDFPSRHRWKCDENKAVTR